jgi:hypothetical protein
MDDIIISALPRESRNYGILWVKVVDNTEDDAFVGPVLVYPIGVHTTRGIGRYRVPHPERMYFLTEVDIERLQDEVEKEA